MLLKADSGTSAFGHFCAALMRKPAFASKLYVLFSVPETMHPAKLVWTASDPNIVISLT